tara:strand:+ start:23433 stop:23774 length:342 start_codon:yes stop_codon:yes gene_type:complete
MGNAIAFETATIAKQDLHPGAGVALKVGDHQIALFCFPDFSPGYFAVGHRDPIGQANVIARGILGDIGGEPVITSPLFKQHFSLRTGVCVEQAEYALPVYDITISQNSVLVSL